MANTIQITLEINSKGEATIKQVEDDFKTLTRTVKDGVRDQEGALAGLRQHWLAVTAAVYAAERSLATVWAQAKRGAEFEETQGRLNRQLAAFGTTADALLPKIQRLAAGQLSLEESSRLSSRALAGGILTPQEIGTFVQLAKILSDIKGGGIEESFGELQRGLMGVRSEAFKSLGIYVDLDQEIVAVARATRRHAEDISEEEKTLIRHNVVLRESSGVFKEHGSAMASDADNMNAMEAQWDNLTLAVSRATKAILLAGLKTSSQMFGTARLASPKSPDAPAGAPSAPAPGDPEALTKLERAQQQAIATAGRHASAVDDITRALLGYDREIARAEELTRRFAEQQRAAADTSRAMREQISQEEGFQAALGRRGMTPEEQLRRIGQQLNDMPTEGSKELIEQLQQLRRELLGLGNTEGADRLVQTIGDKLLRAMRDVKGAADQVQEASKQAAEAQQGQLDKLIAGAAQKKKEFEETWQLKFSGDQELLQKLDEIKAKAAETRAALAGLAIGGGGGSGGAPSADMPAGDLGALAEGTRRVPRGGLARLHYGEAVIPKDMNFLDPAIGGLEREQRLARLASGQIPSFELGTSSFGGSIVGGGFGTNPSGRGGYLPQGDLPIASGLDPFFFGTETPQDALVAINREMAVLVNRLRPENWMGTLGAFRFQMEGAKALTQLMAARDQAFSRMGGLQVPGGGAGGERVGIIANRDSGGAVADLLGSGRLELIVNVVLDGRTITRQSVIPELRQLGLISGGAF